MGSFRPRGLAECLQILWRRKSLILVITAVVLLAAGAVILRMPRLYESRALIVVSGSIYDKTANGAQVAAVTEQITSRANLQALVERYNLFAPVTKMDATVAQFQKEIKFETKYRSDSAGFPESFTVSYRHTDPLIAKQVVTDLVAVFDQANKTLEKQAAEEAQRIRGEISGLEAKLGHASSQRMASAARSTAASRAAGAIERQRSERNAVASTLEALKDRQFALDAQIADQRRLVAQQQEVVRTSPPPPDDIRANNSYGALLKRKADLEGQIQDYSSKFTDKYPKLVQAREQLAEINQRIAEAGNGGESARASASSPAAMELRNLQRELARMETELAIVKREIDRKQQAASGIPSTAGPATPFFQMVDHPNIPESPAAPIRSRLMLIALVIALIASVVGAAAVEARRFSMIYDERDINYYLGVPVVAMIPETLTVPERSRINQRLFARRLVYLAVAVVAIPVLALLLDATKLFQILGSK